MNKFVGGFGECGCKNLALTKEEIEKLTCCDPTDNTHSCSEIIEEDKSKSEENNTK